LARLYYSFSVADGEVCAELRRRLAAWRRAGILDGEPGPRHEPDELTTTTSTRLDQADIAVLFVSRMYLRLEGGLEEELRWILDSAEREQTWCVPLIIEECEWLGRRFAKFPVVPVGGRPLEDWESADDAWTDVVDGLLDVTHRVRFGRPRTSPGPPGARRSRPRRRPVGSSPSSPWTSACIASASTPGT